MSTYRAGLLNVIGPLTVATGTASSVNAATITATTINATTVNPTNLGISGLQGLSLGGALTAASVAATGAVTGATMTATGTVTGANVASTGPVTGASAAITGAVTAATMTATGAVAAATVTATGAVAAATMTATGAVAAASAVLGTTVMTVNANYTLKGVTSASTDVTFASTINTPSIYLDGLVGANNGALATEVPNLGRFLDGSGVTLVAGITGIADRGDVWLTANGNENNNRFIGLPFNTYNDAQAQFRKIYYMVPAWATYAMYAANKVYLDTSNNPANLPVSRAEYAYYDRSSKNITDSQAALSTYCYNVAGNAFINAALCSGMQVKQSIKLPITPSKQTFNPVFDATHIYAIICGGNATATGFSSGSDNALLVKIDRKTGALLASTSYTQIFKGLRNNIPGTAPVIDETTPVNSALVAGRQAPELVGNFIYVINHPRAVNTTPSAIAKLNKSDLARVWAQKPFNTYNEMKSCRTIKPFQPTSGPNAGKTLILVSYATNIQYSGSGNMKGYFENYAYWVAQGGIYCFDDTSGSSVFSDGSGNKNSTGGPFNNTFPTEKWFLNICPKLLKTNDVIPDESFARDSSRNFVNTDSSGVVMKIVYPIVAVLGSAINFPGAPALAGGVGDWSYPSPFISSGANPVTGMGGQPDAVFCTANVYKDASGNIVDVTVDGSGNPNNIYFGMDLSTSIPALLTYKDPVLRTAGYLVTLGFKIDATTADSSNNVTFDKLTNNNPFSYNPSSPAFQIVQANVPFVLTDGQIIWNDTTMYTGTDVSGTQIAGNQIFMGQPVYKNVYRGDKIANKYQAVNLNYWGSGNWGSMSYDAAKDTVYIGTSNGQRQPYQDGLDLTFALSQTLTGAAYVKTLADYSVALRDSSAGEIAIKRALWITAANTYNNALPARRAAKRCARWKRYLCSGLVAVNSAGLLLWHDSAAVYDGFVWFNETQTAFTTSLVGENCDNTLGACIVTTPNRDSSGNYIRRMMSGDKGAVHFTYNPDAPTAGVITAWNGTSADNYASGIDVMNLTASGTMSNGQPNAVFIACTVVGIGGEQGGAAWGGCSDGLVYVTHQCNVPYGSGIIRTSPIDYELDIMNGNPLNGTQYAIAGGRYGTNAQMLTGYVSNKVVVNSQGPTVPILDASGISAQIIPIATSYLVATNCMDGSLAWVSPCSPSLNVSLQLVDIYRGVAGISELGAPTCFNDVAVVSISNGKIHFVRMLDGAMMNTMCFPDGGLCNISGTRDTMYVIGGARKWLNNNTSIVPRMHIVTMNGM